jgi:hypothetical protein
MTKTTYSFQHVSGVISHPLLGQKSFDGSSMVKVTVTYLDNLTESDLGAYGDVMITKVASRRGNVTLEMQQTSSLNKWLINYANKVQNAPAASWADGTITVNENYDNGLNITASDIAIVKRPDRSNAQQGDHVTWEFFSPDITEA